MFGAGRDFLSGEATLTATPLPATWIMMLIGMAGLGFLARRSSRVLAAV